MSHVSMSQAVVYSKNSNFQKEDGLKLMSLLDFHDGMQVLDLGCGTGCLATSLAKQVGQNGQVIAVDPDKARISLAIKKYKPIDNLTFQEGSGETITGQGYDLVFSNYVFHWIQDKKTVLQNVYCSLKPSGKFAVCFETNLSPFVLNYIDLMGAIKANALKNKLHFSSTSGIEDIAAQCGFTVEYKAEVDRVVQFNSFEEFEQTVYGGFGGVVDNRFMEAEKLQLFKLDAERKENKFNLCTIVFYIFKKTA